MGGPGGRLPAWHCRVTDTIDLNYYLASPQRGWEHPCALCGRMLHDGDEQVEVEKDYFEQAPNMMLIRVWHADCRKQYSQKNGSGNGDHA